MKNFELVLLNTHKDKENVTKEKRQTYTNRLKENAKIRDPNFQCMHSLLYGSDVDEQIEI